MKLKQLRESPDHCSHQFGDCGIMVYKIVKSASPQEQKYLHVIEGMVRVKGRILPHTWIETLNGKIIDPTLSQFAGENIEYSPKDEYRDAWTVIEYIEDFEDQYGDLLDSDVLGESIEPWAQKGIGTDPAFPNVPVKMVSIRSIKPIHGRNKRPAKPMDPNKPYEPLRINSRGELQDGSHRYYDLVDNGYTGKVPVVVLNI